MFIHISFSITRCTNNNIIRTKIIVYRAIRIRRGYRWRVVERRLPNIFYYFIFVVPWDIHDDGFYLQQTKNNSQVIISVEIIQE